MKVFIDTETTGLNPIHHSILSVCLGNKEIGYKTFHIRPDPDRIIDPKAMEINNIDLDGVWVDESEKFIRFLEAMTAQFGQLEPIGHNYQFDIGFIQQILGRKRYDKFFSRRYVDTMIVAKFIDDVVSEDPDASPKHSFGYSLSALCKVYEYENEHAHTAEGDVRATEFVYHALMQHVKV